MAKTTVGGQVEYMNLFLGLVDTAMSIKLISHFHWKRDDLRTTYCKLEKERANILLTDSIVKDDVWIWVWAPCLNGVPDPNISLSINAIKWVLFSMAKTYTR